jgi:hypothetical protein
MKINRRTAYLSIVGIAIFLCLLYQGIWIFSRTTMAEIQKTELLGTRRVEIHFIDANYFVGGTEYPGTYLQNGFEIGRRYFPVRYLIFAPGISRPNSFEGNWGAVIFILVLITLVISIIFIRKDIIAEQAFFLVQKSWPFVRIENNEIEDYEEHLMDKNEPGKADSERKRKLEMDQMKQTPESVNTCVYKYNPNAIVIIILYAFYFVWYIHSLFVSAFTTAEIFVFLGILIFVPLYVQNTNNKQFKMKVLDSDRLIFSDKGVEFKEDFYPIDEIDAALVYLESFYGFKYRDRVSTGKVNTVLPGDNNKISFSSKEGTVDFIFYLADYADYCAFKNLMTRWAEKGVNVILQKVFADDFMVQEMVHFHTSDRQNV